MSPASKKRIATTSLCGCFGCHMSLLDIDERLLELAEIVELDRTPLTDTKRISAPCDVGLVEGGCANAENVEVLLEFRRECAVLVSVGDCATMGGVPAMRNTVPLEECLREAFVEGPSTVNPEERIPDDEEIPLLLDKVYPCHEVVKIDYPLPGCPPSAEALWRTLTALLEGGEPSLPYELIKYD